MFNLPVPEMAHQFYANAKRFYALDASEETNGDDVLDDECDSNISESSTDEDGAGDSKAHAVLFLGAYIKKSIKGGFLPAKINTKIIINMVSGCLCGFHKTRVY